MDADEWVSPQLAGEIAARLGTAGYVAFTHRLRLVFMNTWIRHCGWYRGSWVVRLADRRYTKYDGNIPRGGSAWEKVRSSRTVATK